MHIVQVPQRILSKIVDLAIKSKMNLNVTERSGIPKHSYYLVDFDHKCIIYTQLCTTCIVGIDQLTFLPV